MNMRARHKLIPKKDSVLAKKKEKESSSVDRISAVQKSTDIPANVCQFSLVWTALFAFTIIVKSK